MLINLWKTHRLPALQMLLGRDSARAIERWSEEQTAEWTLHVLQHVFGAQARMPAAIERTAWDSDPFSRGWYSYIPVGTTPADIEVLAEPVCDRLLFAGEATYRHHWGCAHGAYASGLREAARIAGDPSILPQRHFTENRCWRAMMMRASRFFNALSETVKGDELVERLAILADSEIFAVVPDNELKILAMMFEPVWFDDGQVICRPGDPATLVYAVAEGEIEVQLRDGSSVRMLRRGSVVGEYGMFGSGTRTATLIAHGRCRALALDYQRFLRFLLAFPESALALMRLTVEQLLNRNEMLEALRQ
jgi:hypothetical protein